MSDNENTVYVFVKGNKGKCACLITDVNFNEIHSFVLEDLLDKKGNPLEPFVSDYEAMLKSLEYIGKSRGKGPVPSEPMIFLYTTYENNYNIASGINAPKKEVPKEYKTKLVELESALVRSNSKTKNVKFHHIPNGFQNKMERIDELLSSNKITRPKKP